MSDRCVASSARIHLANGQESSRFQFRVILFSGLDLREQALVSSPQLKKKGRKIHHYQQAQRFLFTSLTANDFDGITTLHKLLSRSLSLEERLENYNYVSP